MLKDLNASLVTRWISTEKNGTADQLSRRNVGDKYQLNKKIFSKLNEWCGGLDIDIYATNQNTLLLRFNS